LKLATESEFALVIEIQSTTEFDLVMQIQIEREFVLVERPIAKHCTPGRKRLLGLIANEESVDVFRGPLQGW
jgi:hypothetical protein